jgi:hypothetical protein
MFKRLGLFVATGLVVAAGFALSPASATGATGTWTQHQQPASSYQAAIQQPINTANTSNWSSKSKGGIPVMFKLQSAPGTATFQSIGSDGFAGFPLIPGTTYTDDYSYLFFTPSPALTFSQITDLSATYDFFSGNCHGGALRFEVDLANGKNVFVYYGAGPSFTDCTGTNSQSGVNMLTLTDARWDTSQVGGTFYDTYTNALALVGSQQIDGAGLVLDGGWGTGTVAQDQILKAGTTATVNGNTRTWDSGTTGGFSDTCTLPPATIQVSKLTPDATGAINEEPVQASLTDDGNAFRVVDCKYQYVLSIPTLKGAGKYQVEILINNVAVPTPGSPGGEVTFDLK